MNIQIYGLIMELFAVIKEDFEKFIVLEEI